MEDKVMQRYNYTRNKNINFLKLTHVQVPMGIQRKE